MHRYSLKLILPCLFCCLQNLIIVCRGQTDARFEHFTSEDGLSENVIYTVFQDSRRFLWIGTHDGLNRYDGYGFKKFRHNLNDANSIADNTVKSMCEDEQGMLWVTTNAGLGRFDSHSDKFINIDLGNRHVEIEQVITVNKDELMVRHGAGVSLVNIHTFNETLLGFKDNDSIRFGSISPSPLTKDYKGNIYIANKTGKSVNLWKYDSLHKSFDKYLHLFVSKTWEKTLIQFAFADKEGRFWIAITGAAPFVYKPGSAGKKSFFLDLKNGTNETRNIFEDADGNTWVGTDEGLLLYENSTGQIVRYRHTTSPDSISWDFIQSICQDATGILWFGTSNGLNKLNPLKKRFKHLSAINGKPRLFNNFVLGISPENDKQVRIHYNFWNRIFSRFNVDDHSINHFSIAAYNYTDFIKEVVIVNPEKLKDGSLGKAVSILKKIKSTSLKPEGKIIVDDNQNLWYIEWKDLIALNTQKSWEFNFLIAGAKIYKGDIWLATNGDGLISFNVDKQKITKYVSEKNNPRSINSNDITSLEINPDGNLWIGTKGGGLNYFDRKKQTFSHYVEDDGLCNNSIYSMVKDDRGRLWLGTSYGMSCFDPLTRQFKNYFPADGLINSEFNRYSACKIADGTIFMGGMNGIDYFHPDSLPDNNCKPFVQFTDIKVLNKSIGSGGNVLLHHDQNYITIEFAAMDFNNPAGNKFAYKMEGVDKDWISTDNRNYASYSLLSPGKYKFFVKGSNSSGIWNEDPAIYSFTILPAWYQTTWSKSLIILVLIAGIYFFINYYTNKKLEKQRLQFEQQKAIEAERTRISSELHDDMGGELSAIRLLSEMNISAVNPQQQLSKISASAAMLIQKMNEIVWSLNVNNDSLQSLIAYIRNYANKLLDEINIDCTFLQPDKIPDVELNGNTRRNIFLLVKETLNNILKHSSAKSVSIKIETGENLNIYISDNGRGIAAEVLTSVAGNGLKNMKRRVEEMKGSVEISNNNGTTVVFILPILSNPTKG